MFKREENEYIENTIHIYNILGKKWAALAEEHGEENAKVWEIVHSYVLNKLHLPYLFIYLLLYIFLILLRYTGYLFYPEWGLARFVVFDVIFKQCTATLLHTHTLIVTTIFASSTVRTSHHEQTTHFVLFFFFPILFFFHSIGWVLKWRRWFADSVACCNHMKRKKPTANYTIKQWRNTTS